MSRSGAKIGESIWWPADSAVLRFGGIGSATACERTLLWHRGATCGHNSHNRDEGYVTRGKLKVACTLVADDVTAYMYKSITDSRAYHKIKLWGKPLEPRDLTETLERRRPSRRLRLARGSEPASVPFSRNALYYLSQEEKGLLNMFEEQARRARRRRSFEL